MSRRYLDVSLGCKWFWFFFSSRRRHTRCSRDWSSDVCSSDLLLIPIFAPALSVPFTRPLTVTVDVVTVVPSGGVSTFRTRVLPASQGGLSHPVSGKANRESPNKMPFNLKRLFIINSFLELLFVDMYQ